MYDVSFKLSLFPVVCVCRKVDCCHDYKLVFIQRIWHTTECNIYLLYALLSPDHFGHCQHQQTDCPQITNFPALVNEVTSPFGYSIES